MMFKRSNQKVQIEAQVHRAVVDSKAAVCSECHFRLARDEVAVNAKVLD